MSFTDSTEADMASTESAQIFVVGRDGNGKTSTIETIVGDNSETLQDSGEIEVKFSPKYNFSLADGKGVGEPLEDLVENDIEIREIINNVNHVMNNVFHTKLSLNVVVFVLKIGVRLTRQEKKSLQIIKDIFGQDVIRRCGVVVMTYGDNFRKDVNGTFQEWCRKQTGDFKSLMEECNYRCVLFDNRDESKRELQVEEFMTAVEQINDKRPYEYAPNSDSQEKLFKEYESLKAKKLEADKKQITEKQGKCVSQKCLSIIAIVLFISAVISAGISVCVYYFVK